MPGIQFEFFLLTYFYDPTFSYATLPRVMIHSLTREGVEQVGWKLRREADSLEECGWEITSKVIVGWIRMSPADEAG